MRQKESFFLISIKRSCASLSGGGAVLSQALGANMQRCRGVVVWLGWWCGWCGWCRWWITRDELFSLNRYARAINMYVRMEHQCKA